MASTQRPSMWWFIGGLLAAMCICTCVAGAGVTVYLTQQPAPTPTVVVPSPTLAPPSGSAAEDTLRLLSMTEVPLADPIGLAERFKGLQGIPEVVATSADPIPLGTVQSFWASNSDLDEYFQFDAELVYATDHVYFWFDVTAPYDFEEVRALVDQFENHTYPTTRAFFGSEWSPGVDGDPHLYILAANGLGATTAGYYGSNDEYSPLVHEYSNAHEMFYLSADLDLGSDWTSGVLAHEFQHMIHWRLDANEETWMNEGFAELSSFLNGHDPGGADFIYAQDPDLTLSYWPSGPGVALPNYGQSYLFMSYVLDRLGPEGTQALVANTANGLDSIDQILANMGTIDPLTGDPVTADDLYRDWATAFLVQDPSVGDGRYYNHTYTTGPIPAMSDRITNCPVDEQYRQVSQYGIDYIQILCQGDYVLSFAGDPYAQVVPTNPHSGDYAFWSNRGDHSDMTLSRPFDFRDVEGPITFEYWVWFDIEENWDYIYLTTSTDGGDTWEILTTPSGTDYDPVGNSYGWGYTGYSGGGATPVWVQESVDLTQFAGQQVILRFEYVTDAAVNGDGLLLDDLSIPAIGYSEDFEQDEGGWEPAGFVRLSNVLPQSYRLVLVERGAETQVRELALDSDQRFQVDLSIQDDVADVVLIVIGTTRHTWQDSTYRFSITP
ncbi:MAG: immune inhibitor A [Anaerolineales bacterium]